MNREIELDYLRAIAIFGVILVHTAQIFPTGTDGLTQFAFLGRFGVQLFFMVSAYTMCLMWQRRDNENNKTRNFYIRRFMRIAPMFWLAIPIYYYVYGTAPAYFAPTGIGAHTVIMTATFTHGFWPDTISSLVHGGWSIAVEMTFYLFFPFIITVVGKRASSYLVLARIVFVLYRLSVPALREIFSFLYISDSTSIIDEFLYLNFSINFQRFCSGFGSSLCQKIWLPGTSWGQSLSLRFIFSCRGLT